MKKEIIKKTCEVVMLSSKERLTAQEEAFQVTNNGLLFTDGKTIGMFEESDKYLTKQHLYILSEDNIKNLDWVIYFTNKAGYVLKQVLEVTKEAIPTIICTDNQVIPLGFIRGKIIATTNNKLFYTSTREDSVNNPVISYLPRPSKAFIKKYCEKGGNIKKIKVEYEFATPYSHVVEGEPVEKYPIEVKVDSNNEITIFKYKTVYTEEEVKELCEKAYDAGQTTGLSEYREDLDWLSFDDWVDLNF